jgi:hypothetical protein
VPHRGLPAHGGVQLERAALQSESEGVIQIEFACIFVLVPGVRALCVYMQPAWALPGLSWLLIYLLSPLGEGRAHVSGDGR